MFREAEIYAFDYHRWRRGWEQRRGEKLPDFWAEPTEADSGTATAKILSASNEVWPVGRPTAKEQILSEHRRRRTERQESGLPEPPMAVEARDLEKWAKEPGNIPADKRAPVADTIRRHLREEKKRRQG
jgi:hypothetical protein